MKEDTETYLAEVLVGPVHQETDTAQGFVLGIVRLQILFCLDSSEHVRTNPCVYELARGDRLS